MRVVFLDILIFSLAYEAGFSFLSPVKVGMAMGLVLSKEIVAEITPGSFGRGS